MTVCPAPSSRRQARKPETSIIWSFSLDPVFDIIPKAANGVYVTGGAGFYRKVTNFQNPEAQQYCTTFTAASATPTRP